MKQVCKIGVFDSGKGGEIVGQAIKKALPKAEIIVVDDVANLPYGSKTAEQVSKLTDAAIQPLLQAKCHLIVIACNTATALAIKNLRAKYSTQKFVGFEPMIKPAASLTKTGIIGICATPATIKSDNYQRLKQLYATGITVIEPDCSDWASLIQNQQITTADIKLVTDELCSQRADAIALACTHYHLIKEQIQELVGPNVQVIEPTVSVIKRIKNLLEIRD